MKAFYHQTGKAPIECDAEKNPDGTLNLKRNGETLVTNCPVSEKSIDGHATLSAEKAAEEEKADDKTSDKTETAAKDKPADKPADKPKDKHPEPKIKK